MSEAKRYQLHAQMADAGVQAMLKQCEDAGCEDTAIASGALFAVVRYHLETTGAISERALLKIMFPALASVAAALMAERKAPPADPPMEH